MVFGGSQRSWTKFMLPLAVTASIFHHRLWIVVKLKASVALPSMPGATCTTYCVTVIFWESVVGNSLPYLLECTASCHLLPAHGCAEPVMPSHTPRDTMVAVKIRTKPILALESSRMCDDKVSITFSLLSYGSCRCWDGHRQISIIQSMPLTTYK